MYIKTNMAGQQGVVIIYLLFTSIVESSTFSLKRDVAGQTTCEDEIDACRQPDEPYSPYWFSPMFNSDGSFNVNCSANEDQITCEAGLDDSCRQTERHWIEFRSRLTIHQHACNQTAVFTSGKECWATIETEHVLSECGSCDFVECIERVLPDVPRCSDEKHVKFFANMAADIFKHYEHVEYFQC